MTEAMTIDDILNKNFGTEEELEKQAKGTIKEMVFGYGTKFVAITSLLVSLASLMNNPDSTFWLFPGIAGAGTYVLGDLVVRAGQSDYQQVKYKRFLKKGLSILYNSLKDKL